MAMTTAKKTRKVLTNKTNYMSDEAFAELKEAMEDALAFDRGRQRDLQVTRIRAPRAPKAMSLTQRIRSSQGGRRKCVN